MIRLSVVGGVEAGEVLEREGDLFRIGRAESNELSVPAEHVSAEHASIAYTDIGYVLRDHHSTNGTRVRRAGEVIDLAEEPGRELRIRSGDRILLGEMPGAVEIDVELDDEEDAEGIVSTRTVAEIGKVEDRAAADRDILRALYEAQKAISRESELSEVLDAVSEQVFRMLPRATHVAVALREEGGESDRRSSRYLPFGSRERGGGEDAGAIPITRSVFRKVVEERSAVLAADARKDVGETASMLAASIVSTIGVPLWQGDEILGVLQVDNRAQPGMFGEPDLDRVALLAQTASEAFARARMLTRLRAAEERQRSQNDYLKRLEEHRRVDGIIGESAAMQAVFDQIRKVADTRVSVLVEGETGTGKELVASAVHYWSKRRDQLFVAQNCAALPENLLESELFGHRKGAFTGATEDKKGLFVLSDGGTLFLDEVGEMPAALQAKLLRVLQEGEVRPVGAVKSRPVDVRIVAATNRDLEREVSEGRFREDLYYRLRVFPIRLPPLRERREDIPLLAGHFLGRYAEEFGRAVGGFAQEAMELLSAYEWPGNVRELQNEVQRLIIQVDDREFIRPADLSPRIRKAENVLERVKPDKGTLKEMMEQVERFILAEALREHDNNKTATAKSLGITREGLHKKLKGHGMA